MSFFVDIRLWRAEGSTWYLISNGNGHNRCSIKKGVLKIFAKLSGKHLRQNLFFNKVAELRPTFKKRLWLTSFPVSSIKFLRTPFLQNTSGRLLLNGLQKFWVSCPIFFKMITSSKALNKFEGAFFSSRMKNRLSVTSNNVSEQFYFKKYTNHES